LAIWLAATRPRTLVAGAAPVLVGLAVASNSAGLDYGLAALTLAAALLLQVGTNLANDYYDWAKGIDTAERLGPLRVTQSGLLSAATMRRAISVVFALAICIGAWLVLVGGWPIIAIGLLSIAAALGYSSGPWPLAAHGLGEVLAFCFFGVVAVCGTAYLQSGRFDFLALFASAPMGALAAALIVVNNLRDIPTDTAAGKRTVAVRIGDSASRYEYACLVILCFLLIAGFAALVKASAALALLAVPLGLYEIRWLWARTGAELNLSLAGTARLYSFVAGLFVVGLLL